MFAQVQERYLAKKKLNDTCRLGLLKYLSEKRRLTETQYQAADELLLSCLTDHMFLSSMRKLPPTLLKKYHLQERFFLEYHTKPARHNQDELPRRGGAIPHRGAGGGLSVAFYVL